ncbi:MAG TPA: beta-galactosidase trimerization domain-containing protein, partial [Isosphaeraceae bacterium]|nr:beta-galactosidase trimerization domain-containing protein [Isosphaeraceae bacterium]
TIGELAPTLFADRQARSGLMPPWFNGKSAKEYRATMGSKPIAGIFSMGVEEAYRWKDSVQTEAEVRIWVAEGIANGLRPWFAKFAATLRDNRWLDIVERLYRWHHSVERYLRNEASLARVALVYSQQTAWFYGGTRARQKVEDHALGWYQALIEGRIPFEMVHDRLLDADHLDQFKTLILPNIAALSDEQCRLLRAFVDRGGSVVATYETSLYDEWGTKRKDFGLADLFGVSFRGRGEGPMKNAYLRLEDDPDTGRRHPILAGFDEAPRIIHGTYRLDVGPTRPFPHPPLTLIPSYPDLPMEKVYPRIAKTDTAEVYLREIGQARIAYFPWDIDRIFWEVLAVDHATLLQNAVRWATNEEPPVRVTGPGVLDVTAWRQKDSMTVHLVNLTNPMMMKGPFRELFPVGEQRLVVRLPEGSKAKKVQLLAAEREVPVEQDGAHLTVTVPSVRDLEVVAIDF